MAPDQEFTRRPRRYSPAENAIPTKKGLTAAMAGGTWTPRSPYAVGAKPAAYHSPAETIPPMEEAQVARGMAFPAKRAR